METLAEILGIPKVEHPKPSVAGQPNELPLPPEAEVESVEAKIARNIESYFHNPWSMVEDSCIYTLDQTDMLNPIKPFPNKPWLKTIAEIWLEERLIALYKSRRMTITWLMIFLHLWLAMMREGVAVFFVSDKEDKSNELVDRAKFIFKYIPNDMFLKPQFKSSYCYLEFPGLNSYIQGVAQGPDQLRQFTATAIFFDEFAFWEQAKATFMASKPTTDGGGKLTCVSSPREGFMRELCFDLIR